MSDECKKAGGMCTKSCKDDPIADITCPDKCGVCCPYRKFSKDQKYTVQFH